MNVCSLVIAALFLLMGHDSFRIRESSQATLSRMMYKQDIRLYLFSNLGNRNAEIRNRSKQLFDKYIHQIIKPTNADYLPLLDSAYYYHEDSQPYLEAFKIAQDWEDNSNNTAEEDALPSEYNSTTSVGRLATKIYITELLRMGVTRENIITDLDAAILWELKNGKSPDN